MLSLKKSDCSPPKSPHSPGQNESTATQSEQAQNRPTQEVTTSQQTRGSVSVEGQATGADGTAESTVAVAPSGQQMQTVSDAEAAVLVGSASLFIGTANSEMLRLCEIEAKRVTPKVDWILICQTIRASLKSWITFVQNAIGLGRMIKIMAKIIAIAGCARIIGIAYPLLTVVNGRLQCALSTIDSDGPPLSVLLGAQTDEQSIAIRFPDFAKRIGAQLIAEIANYAGAEVLAELARATDDIGILVWYQRVAPSALIAEIVQCTGKELITDVAKRRLPRIAARTAQPADSAASNPEILNSC